MNFPDKLRFSIIQIACYLALPVVNLCIFIGSYKNAVSQFFFILFAFYFGYKTDCYLDLQNHYASITYFIDSTLAELFSNPELKHLGTEPFHIIFKYIVFNINDSSRFFAGCAAALYATMFILYIRQYRQFYLQKLSTLQFLALCGMFFTVEYYWYLGLRYWTGAFFFMIFYSKYIFTNNRKYLYISFLSVLFHIAHLAVVFAVILNSLLGKRNTFRYILVIISFIYRSISTSFLALIGQIPYLNKFIKPEYLNPDIIASIQINKSNYMREYGNIVYQSRTDILFVCCMLVLFTIWKHNKKVNYKYNKFYSFILTFLVIANVGYSNITYFERTYKFVTLLGFSYLFAVLCMPENKSTSNRIITVILFIAILFAIATTVVQQREYLFDPLIWFSNFFI